MKKKFCLLVLILSAISCGKQIIIYNETDYSRENEVVEIDLCDLGGEDVFILDEKGEEIPSQVTYDDKLIFKANVPANGKSVYHIEKGTRTYEEKHNVDRQNAPSVAVLSGGEAVFSSEVSRTEVLDNGPIRYTASVLYYPIPVDTMWVKERKIITTDGDDIWHEKVWFEDLVGEHEIMVGIQADLQGSISVHEDSTSISNGDISVQFEEQVHNIGYRTEGKLYLVGFCTKEGPEPIEYSWGKNTSIQDPLIIEVCGNGN